ncbi:MAG TPA: dihydrofolate reductase [Bdellovibrionota bacterium]|nr:dihydrofolate reductase [Bdellovibrionota bacterium]
MSRIALVVAMSENRVIGREGALPWRLPEDLKRFKEITMGQTILMGRKTYESIGRLLPGRTHLIVSRSAGYDVPGARVFGDLESALAAAKGEWVYVIGGGEIYRQAMPLAERLYVTHVHAQVEGDTEFPEIPPAQFREMAEERRPGNPEFTFATYERI